MSRQSIAVIILIVTGSAAYADCYFDAHGPQRYEDCKKQERRLEAIERKMEDLQTQQELDRFDRAWGEGDRAVEQFKRRNRGLFGPYGY